MIEVKIVDFSVFGKGRGEQALTQLVNQGWQIAAAGGGGSFPSYIVILQRASQVRHPEGMPGPETWDVDPPA
jgi:hypothetical protein